MKKILYVLHSGSTGGTFLTNKDLMKNVEKKYEIFLLGAENHFLRLYAFMNGELKVIKEYPRHLNLNVQIENSNTCYKNWSAKEFHNTWLTFIYFDILDNYNIDIVHIRHLINHSFDLPQIAKKLGIPVILSIHDFYFICPFYVLLNENNDYCSGNCSSSDKNCYCPMDSLSDINVKEFIPKWRQNVLKMFSDIDYFISTSNFVKELFLSVYTNKKIINKTNFKIIEHGRDFNKINKKFYEVPSLNKPIKILCSANHLNIMKGSELIKKIKKEDENNLIEFHFLGNCKEDICNYGMVHGTFERDEFPEKVFEIQPSFIGIFSIWPETFCHTLTEAWSCGIPVLGTNIGVIKERIEKNNGGWIVDKDNPKNIYNQIIQIVEDKENYLEIVNNIKKINFKNTKTMSDEYLELYDSLLNTNL